MGGGGLFQHIPHVIASCGEARAEPVAAELADDKVEELSWRTRGLALTWSPALPDEGQAWWRKGCPSMPGQWVLNGLHDPNAVATGRGTSVELRVSSYYCI